ncbi:MAG: divergent polysaccharide deacetylase family protein [Alphaproteobacteria bacterium]
MDDLGIDIPRTARAIKLKGPLTLSFMTYATKLDKQTKAARNAGHELWMHIPMEPGSPDIDPGPNVLLTGLPKEELRASIFWHLNQFSGHVGINNHMGSRFTTDETAMALVLAEVQERGLLFVDSRTASDSVGERLARALGVPTLRRDVFLDNDADGVRIGMQLDALERHARDHGYAIDIAHPRPETIEVLSRWLSNVARRGFVLVPISTIAARDQGTEMAAGE